MPGDPRPSGARRAPFPYRGIAIVPTFADARSRELERGMREVAVRIGLLLS